MAEIAAAQGQGQADPVHRSGRRALSPLRDHAEAGRPGGDVLPDGRLGLDDRAHEGSGEALLLAALPVPEAPLRARRGRLHPPHRQAKEVDEETFFYSPATGGTVVSTALEEMHEIVRARFRPADWNIYAAQASDGDNSTSDGEVDGPAADDEILPRRQYYAYLEVGKDAEPDVRNAATRRCGRSMSACASPARRCRCARSASAARSIRCSANCSSAA